MTQTRAVPFSSKFAFGVGQFAEGLKNTGFGVFVLFYYNQVLGLSGTLTGAALFVALLFDALSDPMAGSLSDNWKSKLGRRHPFMYASAVPLALAFFGLFSPPGTLSETQLFVWLVVFAVLTRGAMTLYHVPHLALGAEMTESFQERTKIVAFRQFFGTFGGAAAYLIGLGYFFSDANGGRLAADNYAPFAITLGALMVITIWYSALGTQKEVPFLSPLRPSARSRHNVFMQFVTELRQASQSMSFRWLFFGVLIVCIMAGINTSLDLYMLQYFWELPGSQMLMLQLGYFLGLLLGTFFTATLHLHYGKRFGMIVGTVFWATLQIMPVVLRLIGWFPENGAMELTYTLVVMKFFQGVMLQQCLISFGSMIADIADEHEHKFKVRQEGVFFGAMSFSTKSTSGFGTFIGGVGLDLIAWPRGVNIKTAADIPLETLTNLGILYGPVVAAFAVIAVWCYTHYKLDAKRHAELLADLHVQRAQ